jgi:glycosyltransferase involved in cell wall biosynthesis
VDQSLNILFVADVSITNIGSGAERVLYEQSRSLASKGHEVHLLTRRLPLHESKEEEIDGVKECRYSFNKKLPYPFLKSTFYNCRRSFNSLQSNSPYHIINFHQPFSAVGVLSSQASRAIPTVYTCHSLSFEEYTSQSSKPINLREWVSLRMQLIGRKLLEKKVLRKSDHIVVLSEYTKGKLLKAYGLSPTKIHIISGGVDLHRFRPPEDKKALRTRFGLPNRHFTLLTVRNLEPRMGLENLILAFKKVVENKADTLLILGGEGPLASELENLAREAGIADLVKFTGFIPEEELPYYYQMADLFILPTRELEGFGLVTVEALASGLPVLGTPVGGTKEILAHVGPEFLFSDATPNSMAGLILKSMQTWSTNPESYNQISRKCRKVAEKYYSWNTHIERLENLFQVAIQLRSSNARSDP